MRATRLGWEPGPGSLVHARASLSAQPSANGPTFAPRPISRFLDYATRRGSNFALPYNFYYYYCHYHHHLALLVLCSPLSPPLSHYRSWELVPVLPSFAVGPTVEPCAGSEDAATATSPQPLPA